MSIQNEANERRVVLSEVPEEEAKKLLGGASDISLGEKAIPKFTKKSYQSFKVEFSTIDDDLVVHFFLPAHANLNSPEARDAWMSYWLKVFPASLDPVARSYFEADHPRLVAKYTEEVASWWFRARGFGDVLDAEGFLSKFFERLDDALQKST